MLCFDGSCVTFISLLYRNFLTVNDRQLNNFLNGFSFKDHLRDTSVYTELLLFSWLKNVLYPVKREQRNGSYRIIVFIG